MEREEAWSLLCEHTQSESLRRHGLGVEAVMRALARKHGGDEALWGVTGLIHDFDYERWPDPPDHPLKGSEILRARGADETIVRAILGHASYTGVPRDTLMARALFAADELTGFVFAVSLVRPSRSVHDVEVGSVKKKLKDKAFARTVNREEVAQGMSELGVEPDAHIALVIEALKGVADRVGLSGAAAAAPGGGEG
jgi:predicted hydrolase (HD superfamily)